MKKARTHARVLSVEVSHRMSVEAIADRQVVNKQQK
jgi:hypothetical protein